ncbi:KH domain [Musa troglodytarum]|uniref:Branchpoint-bridging protein n=1 Tax=Musa troglodytarum TaxID=320322 RepID=A0A9E7JDF6_9LILI|nr:KH domain [Musa troglodytarum]
MDCNLYIETDYDKETPNCEHKNHSEPEYASQESNYEEESNGEEEPSEEIAEEEDPAVEAKPCERDVIEGLYWTEPTEEDPQEQVLDEESIGVHEQEDTSEGFRTQLSSNGDDEECELGSKPSSSDKKRRSADESQGNMQKRQKQDDSKLEIYSYATSVIVKAKATSSSCDENIADKENTGSSGNRKRSRSNMEPETYKVEFDIDLATKTRKTRSVNNDAKLKSLGPLKLPDFDKIPVGGTCVDPVTEKLNLQLFEINRMLSAQVLVDDQPKVNESDIQINSRVARLRTRLIKHRQKIILELIKRNPTFDPPDIKPPKLYKKLYIPVKEYPSYNFIGLIIGPRGNTQKRMEMETGAKISLRGRGSIRKGRVLTYKDSRCESSEDDDLHVYIEADTQNSLDSAVQMVEKLLVPVEEERNEHKRAQLRELAVLNGKLGKDSSEIQKTTPRSSTSCDICGMAFHPSVACRLIASNTGIGKSDKFFAWFGCSGVGLCNYPPLPSSRSNLMSNQQFHAPASSNSKPLKEIDEAKLYVCHLPLSVNDDKLLELFSPFGCISEAIVIKDKTTGLSKGYGFVKYGDPAFAAEAVASMNGYRIEGKMLSVQVANQPSSASKTCTFPWLLNNCNKPPPFPTPAISQGKPGVMTWPGHPGSMISEIHASIPKKSRFISHAGFIHGPPFFFGASNQNSVHPLIPHAVTSFKEPEQFPGYPKIIEFQDRSYCSRYHYRPPSKYVHPTQTHDSCRASFAHQMPPP